MKNHPWVLGFVALSLVTGACGDKSKDATGSATADAPGTSSSSASDDKSDKKKHHEHAKSDASGKPDDSSKPGDSKDSAVAPTAPAGAAGAALSHLSDDCQIAAHIDLGQLIANPSFQKEIVPGLDDVLATESKDKDFGKFQAFLKEAGLDYKKSIHDVAICVGDVKNAEHSWSVIIGTDMKPDTLAPAMGKEAKKGAVEDLDGHKVFVAEKVTIGQGDGVVIIAADKDMYKKTLAAKGASAFTIDASKYLAFEVRENAMKSLLTLDPKTPDQLKGLKAVKGGSDLASLKTELVGECNTPDDAKNLEAFVTLMKGELAKKAAGSPGADVLKSLTSKVDGSNVVVEITTPQDSFDQGLKMVGAQLKEAKTKL
jgi:hypothetical protein